MQTVTTPLPIPKHNMTICYYLYYIISDTGLTLNRSQCQMSSSPTVSISFNNNNRHPSQYQKNWSVPRRHARHSLYIHNVRHSIRRQLCCCCCCCCILLLVDAGLPLSLQAHSKHVVRVADAECLKSQHTQRMADTKYTNITAMCSGPYAKSIEKAKIRPPVKSEPLKFSP